MKVALLGCTGLVGRKVMELLARLDQVDRVYCPVRKMPDLAKLSLWPGCSKLDIEAIDFDHPENVSDKFRGCAAVVCCLGTTRKQAGSRSAQERVDVRLPLTFAAIAKKQGVKHFLCVSAQGANTESPFFYNRLKGMLEEGLTMMNFDSLTLVRPSLLLGKHKDRRFGEELLQKVFGKHPEWIPDRIRPVHAETVAAHLVASLLKPPTQHVCASDGVKGKRIIYNRVLAQTKVDELL